MDTRYLLKVIYDKDKYFYVESIDFTNTTFQINVDLMSFEDAVTAFKDIKHLTVIDGDGETIVYDEDVEYLGINSYPSFTGDSRKILQLARLESKAPEQTKTETKSRSASDETTEERISKLEKSMDDINEKLDKLLNSK